MAKGKWFLVYTFVNEMEAGTFRDGIEDEKVLLNATMEDAAISEAKARWADVVAKSEANWKKQKETWVHPPKTVFGDVSPDPRVIYLIPLV